MRLGSGAGDRLGTFKPLIELVPESESNRHAFKGGGF